MPREYLESVDPKELIIIGLDTDDGEEHPLYDERVFLPVDENLVKNISVYGVQQPVLVRKEGDVCYVIDGRQRTRAARKANQSAEAAGEYSIRVPIRLVAQSDNRVAGIMISTNELRQEDDVLAKALKAQRLLSMTNSISEVATAFGRSEQTIRNWMLLVEADPRLHSAIKAQKISVSAAIEVARLKRDEQRETLETLIKASGAAPVSHAQAQAALASTDTTKASAGTVSEDAQANSDKRKHTKVKNNQKGIKRVWLRQALNTDAAAALTDEQRAVLIWIATGESSEGDWFIQFMADAEEEMAQGGKRSRKKGTSVKASDSATAFVKSKPVDGTTDEEGNEADDQPNTVEDDKSFDQLMADLASIE
jgi:ParB family chromosome partitioning protein